MQIIAQNKNFLLNFKGNVISPLVLDLNEIKDITFVNEPNMADIDGEWLCLNDGYEAVFFDEDGKVNYQRYFESADRSIKNDGKYALMYDILALQFNMSGLQYLPIVRHTETSFTMRNGDTNYDYYKIQNTYELKIGDAPVSIGNDGDVIEYVDKVCVSMEGNNIKGVKKGVGYALVKNSETGNYTAYHIDVTNDQNPNIIDWTQYFNMTKEEIISLFGEPYYTDMESNKEDLIYPLSLGYLFVSIKVGTGKVSEITIIFDKYDDFWDYYSELSQMYYPYNTGDDSMIIFTEKEYYYESSFYVGLFPTNNMISYALF